MRFASAQPQPAPSGDYTRPPREDGTLIATPPPREVPASERALVSATAARSESIGPPRWGYGALATALVAGIGLALTWQLTQPRRRDPSRASERAAARGSTSLHPGIEVRTAAFALDWNLRASVEHTLSQARSRTNTQTAPPLHATASAMRDALARVLPSIRAAAVQSWSITPDESFAFFERIADTMQSRIDTWRTSRRPPPPGPPVGVVVAVLTVSTKCPLPPIAPALDARALLVALEGLVPPRPELVAAVDVVWVPDEQSAALTQAEAAALFPELVSISAPS